MALGAQAGLYLILRRIAVATMPAWAHFHHHPAPVVSDTGIVGVAVVHDTARPERQDAPPPVIVPQLEPLPVIPIPPPDIPADGADGPPQQ